MLCARSSESPDVFGLVQALGSNSAPLRDEALSVRGSVMVRQEDREEAGAGGGDCAG
jgi:hypothetical protein